ncbi:MAG: hypothetical protein C5B57_04645 [Blastocatellia bacterium]|nr:MAG: hypothetical protein C5B57_04645 [Blastocatellia bacterium]
MAVGSGERRHRRTSAVNVLLPVVVVLICAPGVASGQWLHYPTADVPRTGDGKPNLDAPAPRQADGKPDFSGIWLTATKVPCTPGKEGGFFDCGLELPISPMAFDVGAGVSGGLPYQPWAAALVKQRVADSSKDDPHVRCLPDNPPRPFGLPHLTKAVHTPRLLVLLNEVNAMYRQIFIDGRPLPTDPTPSWNGYSSAAWEGDTLVVHTIGFRDGLWLDTSGSPMTDAAKMIERIRRPNFGRLEVEVTVDDPKAYTRPWTVSMPQDIRLDTELIDEFCLENEKSSQHMRENK